MSAIGAICWHKPAHRGGDALRRMEVALSMHGPDRQSRREFGPCGLVSVLSLGFTQEDALEHQPVLAAKRWSIVFSGWISHRSEVGRMLGISPRQQRQLSDSAVLAKAWERWSTDALNHVGGHYALLVWDQKDRALYAARSAGSAPPLHYHRNAERTAFSTVPKGLFAIGHIDRRYDRLKLAQNLQLEFEDRERSYFQGITRLPTGHVLMLANGKIDLWPFYDPRDAPEIRYRRHSDYVDAARELFDRAVTDALRAREAPAISLSSGLDSCAVAASVLHKTAPNPLVSFTALPEPGWDRRVLGNGCVGDERAGVDAMARAYSTLETNFVDCASQDNVDDLRKCFAHGEIVPRNVMNVGWWTAIAKSTRARGKRVLLTGESGNATLSYQAPLNLVRLIRSGRPGAALRYVRRKVRGLAFSPAMPPTRDWSAVDLRWRSCVRNWEIAPANRSTMAQALFGGVRDEACDLSFALQSSTGVQIRDPLGDRTLAEFCLGIPPETYEHGGVNRSLIKSVMGHRLPDTILHAPRACQSADIHLKLTRQRCELQHELARGKADPDLCEFIDFNRLLDLLNTWPEVTPLSAKDHPDYLLVHLGLPRALANIRFAHWADGAAV